MRGGDVRGGDVRGGDVRVVWWRCEGSVEVVM